MTTNDRTIIGILKELDFLDADGVPKDRYYHFLDRSQSEKIVAEGVREAYSGLFAVNKDAQKLSLDEVKNKLRTLYKGAKKDNLIARIASTFVALCEYADFTTVKKKEDAGKAKDHSVGVTTGEETKGSKQNVSDAGSPPPRSVVSLDALQYHINIVLPESRDSAVYDAIFKSLRDHLGPAE